MVRYYPYNQNRAGFTAVELLVALMVCAIVFTAVASLAYALGSASSSTEDLSAHQMALRYATVRISELVKHSVMAFAAPGGIALWTGDKNNNGFINGSELVYIETGAGGQSLRLLDFILQEDELDISVTAEEIRNGTARDELFDVSQMQEYYTDENYIIRYISVLPECSNVRLTLDVQPTLDGTSTFVNILFDLTEAGVTSTYQICTTLRCSADHLLNPATGEPDGVDDD